MSLSLLSLYMSSPTVVFVEWRLLHVLRPCPFVVSSDSGKCLVTTFAVRPGHNANCLFLIAIWFGGESHLCMVVADKLRLCLEFVGICNSLGWGRLLGKELHWQAVAKECLSIIVLYVFYN